MLILTRRPGETLELTLDPAAPADLLASELFRDGPITVAVTEIPSSGQARIGIDAPQLIAIRRDELSDRERV